MFPFGRERKPEVNFMFSNSRMRVFVFNFTGRQCSPFKFACQAKQPGFLRRRRRPTARKKSLCSKLNVRKKNAACQSQPSSFLLCSASVSVPGHQGALGVVVAHEMLSAWQVFGVEFVLTFLIVFTVFATVDPNRRCFGSDSLAVGIAYLACTISGVSWFSSWPSFACFHPFLCL